MNSTMNKSLLIILFSLVYSYGQANYRQDTVKVKVKNWGTRGRILMPAYFTLMEPKVVAQVGKEEFEKIKAFSNSDSWPVAMQGSMTLNGAGGVDSIQRHQAFYRKLDELKLYQVAKFNFTKDGVDWGNRVILRVTYKGNENWDRNAKWDTVYFILREDAVEPFLN